MFVGGVPVAALTARQKTLSSYLGQVATRGLLPSGGLTLNSFRYTNSISTHILRDNVTSLRIVLPGWHALNGVETNIASPIPVTAAIQIGSTYYQITFGGVAQGSIPVGANYVSDPVAVTAAAGTTIKVRLFMDGGSNGVPYFSGPLYASSGETVELSNTATDKTMGGSVANNWQAGAMIAPVGILAQTSKPSVMLLGDSRCAGAYDACDATLDVGELARSIGTTLGHMNYGISGLRAGTVSGSNAKQVAMSQYVTHVVCQLGVNDIAANQTDAQLRASINSIRSAFSAKPMFLTTIPPETSSTDNWKTSANQTAKTYFSTSGNGTRETHNDWRRTIPTGFAGVFEIADFVETSRNSGLWKSDGSTANLWTADGIHESQVGYQAIKNSGVVSTGAFVR